MKKTLANTAATVAAKTPPKQQNEVVVLPGSPQRLRDIFPDEHQTPSDKNGQ